MKKTVIWLFFCVLLLSAGALLVCAFSGQTVTTEEIGAYAGGQKENFSTVGEKKILWEPSLSQVIDTEDKSLADWENSTVTPIVLDADHMISWIGNGDKILTGGEGEPDPDMPSDFQMTAYFAADMDYLYVAIQVRDDQFVPTDSTDFCNGDTIRIGIDMGDRIADTASTAPLQLRDQRNVMYSAGCWINMPDIRIKREASETDGWITSADGIKGMSYQTEGGWTLEAAFPWEMLCLDVMEKTGDTSRFYVGGTQEKPLEIGVTLSYLSRDEKAGAIKWAASACTPTVNENQLPTVSHIPAENGLRLIVEPVEGMTYSCEQILVLSSGQSIPLPSTAKTTAAATSSAGTSSLSEYTAASHTPNMDAGNTVSPTDDRSAMPIIVTVVLILSIAVGAAYVYMKRKKH